MDWTGLSRYTGVDALKDVHPRMEVLDDGTKSGGVAMGWAATHGKLSYDFTTTLGNRVARFEKFV